MKIESYGDDFFSIEINWPSSAYENTAWYFVGEYNEDYGDSVFLSCKIFESKFTLPAY